MSFYIVATQYNLQIIPNTNFSEKSAFEPGTPPKDYTKPQKTTQSPNRQFKDPTDNTKPRQTILSPEKAVETCKKLDNTFKQTCKTQEY